MSEAYQNGWLATRWLPAGVATLAGFAVVAPQLLALGKDHGYLTLCEVVFDRFNVYAHRSWPAHALHGLCFVYMQVKGCGAEGFGVEGSELTSEGTCGLDAFWRSADILLAPRCRCLRSSSRS